MPVSIHIRLLLVFCTLLVSGLARAEQPEPIPNSAESAAERDARMAWFRDARFGMFVHWGLYSVAAGEWEGQIEPNEGEWIMKRLQIPLTKYAQLVPQFNPVKFDADHWVRIAKDAGMKYIIVTTKHHDGFAIYPTETTDWSIKSTPFKRDPLKELAAACKAHDIELCFYYSIMDWHHPDYTPRAPWNDIDKAHPNFDQYVSFMKAQLKELLTNYGPIGVLWFDGHWEETWTRELGADLEAYVRSLQPEIIINNRVGKNLTGVHDTTDYRDSVGDYGTPEQQIPATGFDPPVDWETCMTMNKTWGYKHSDNNWKSTEDLIRNLVDIASKGGNYLLNVGPDGQGEIPEASVNRLQGIGGWMKANGQSIYGTTANPFPQTPWGRCTNRVTSDGGVLYLHVFDWPSDSRLRVPGLKNKIIKASLLATGEQLEVTDDNGEVIVTVPHDPIDQVDTVIALEYSGELDIAQSSDE